MCPAASGAPEERIEVRTSVGSYPVRIGRGSLAELPELLARHCRAHGYAVIADARVWGLHGDRVRAVCSGLDQPLTIHTFEPGEQSKNRSEWSRLTDSLLATGLGRDGCVIALGGGVAGDLAGFVAATYMRGIPVVQVPTSLVAMVDASVGGKTGVDVPAGKNLVGAFHPPRFVLADPDLSVTLPRTERSQGLAEAIKHGAILDPAYFAWIEARAEDLLGGDPHATGALVIRSAELKALVVGEDEREAGMRQILNFGHTLGHALEAESEFRLPHGSAVAIGMVLEARLGERLGVTERGVSERIAEVLDRVELPTRAPDRPDLAAVLELASRDKKARSGISRYVLLSRIGSVDRRHGWSRELGRSVIEKFLAGVFRGPA